LDPFDLVVVPLAVGVGLPVRSVSRPVGEVGLLGRRDPVEGLGGGPLSVVIVDVSGVQSNPGRNLLVGGAVEEVLVLVHLNHDHVAALI